MADPDANTAADETIPNCTIPDGATPYYTTATPAEDPADETNDATDANDANDDIEARARDFRNASRHYAARRALLQTWNGVVMLLVGVAYGIIGADVARIDVGWTERTREVLIGLSAAVVAVSVLFNAHMSKTRERNNACKAGILALLGDAAHDTCTQLIEEKNFAGCCVVADMFDRVCAECGPSRIVSTHTWTYNNNNNNNNGRVYKWSP